MNISKLTKLSSLCALAIIGCYTINELHATGRNVKNCAANGDVMTATFSWFVNAEGGYVFASVEGGQTVTKTATGSCSASNKRKSITPLGREDIAWTQSIALSHMFPSLPVRLPGSQTLMFIAGLMEAY